MLHTGYILFINSLEEDMSAEHSSVSNPCGEFGPTQRWALVWFFGAIIIGTTFAYVMAFTDFYNYSVNGEFFKYDSYSANRFGQNGIQSDSLDPRSDGRMPTAPAAHAAAHHDSHAAASAVHAEQHPAGH